MVMPVVGIGREVGGRRPGSGPERPFNDTVKARAANSFVLVIGGLRYVTLKRHPGRCGILSERLI